MNDSRKCQQIIVFSCLSHLDMQNILSLFLPPWLITAGSHTPTPCTYTVTKGQNNLSIDIVITRFRTRELKTKGHVSVLPAGAIYFISDHLPWQQWLCSSHALKFLSTPPIYNFYAASKGTDNDWSNFSREALAQGKKFLFTNPEEIIHSSAKFVFEKVSIFCWERILQIKAEIPFHLKFLCFT